MQHEITRLASVALIKSFSSFLQTLKDEIITPARAVGIQKMTTSEGLWSHPSTHASQTLRPRNSRARNPRVCRPGSPVAKVELHSGWSPRRRLPRSPLRPPSLVHRPPAPVDSSTCPRRSATIAMCFEEAEAGSYHEVQSAATQTRVPLTHLKHVCH
jgi:hypothetical protein